jgi:hypothetical protein
MFRLDLGHEGGHVGVMLIARVGAASLEVFLRALDGCALRVGEVKRRFSWIRHVLDDIGNGHDVLVVERRELGGYDGDGFDPGHVHRIAQRWQAYTVGVPSGSHDSFRLRLNPSCHAKQPMRNNRATL